MDFVVIYYRFVSFSLSPTFFLKASYSFAFIFTHFLPLKLFCVLTSHPHSFSTSGIKIVRIKIFARKTWNKNLMFWEILKNKEILFVRMLHWTQCYESTDQPTLKFPFYIHPFKNLIWLLTLREDLSFRLYKTSQQDIIIHQQELQESKKKVSLIIL